MANREHLETLAKGVESWNWWRKEQPGIRPNLDGADLGGANLARADLSHANLFSAKLTHANLSVTDLRNADLESANLREANLSSAVLTDAKLLRATLPHARLTHAALDRTNLTYADLSGADLTLANLTDANLYGSDLSSTNLCLTNLNRANLIGAIAGFTVFGDVDLGVARGLDSVTHQAPSTLGLDTIYRSAGKIPDSFLRGAGVPENFITYMRSLTRAAFDFYSCFVSYSTRDQEFAEQLYANLQAKGVRCWFAPEDLKIGDRFRMRIDESIRFHDKLLLVLSRDSIGSPWVEKEAETAFERERREKRVVLFPIRLDDAVMETREAWAADIRRTRHIGDFTGWKDLDSYLKAFGRLVRDLKAEGRDKATA